MSNYGALMANVTSKYRPNSQSHCPTISALIAGISLTKFTACFFFIEPSALHSLIFIVLCIAALVEGGGCITFFMQSQGDSIPFPLV